MTPAKQRGMTIMGWLLVAIAIAATVTVALRLGPHYLDFRTIQAVMSGLPASEVHLMTTKDIQELLKKRFKINNIRDLDLRDAVTIDRTKEETVLIVDYERREPLIYNVDAVMVFKENFRFD